MLNKLIIVLAIFFCVTKNISAIEVDGLYHVDIAVEDQSRENRQKMTLEAFKEVLIRKSGSANILSSYEVIRSLTKVDGYLQRFEYSRNQDFNAQYVNNDLLTFDANQSKAYILKLDFDPRLVDELIQISGMPIWGNNRPLTIIWLALEDSMQRRIIKDETENNLYPNIIRANAVRRGIPIMLPLMDLDDQQNVKISDVWGRFNSEIIPASQRYAADSVVFGRVEQIAENWLAKLSFYSAGNEVSFEINEQTKELLFSSMTNRIADLLCEKYCVVEAAERHQILMQISNVRNFKQFTKVKNYLSNLSAIRNVEINKIAGDKLRLKLGMLGDVNSLKKALSLNSQLTLDEKPLTDAFKLVIEDKPISPNNELVDSGIKLEQPIIEESGLIDVPGLNISDNLVKQEIPILYYRWIE